MSLSVLSEHMSLLSLSSTFLFFFFFKQKTAYEMRISDWSSDVCSSDLPDPLRPSVRLQRAGRPTGGARRRHCAHGIDRPLHGAASSFRGAGERQCHQSPPLPGGAQGCPPDPADRDGARSEEHTSELQSLMRTSYAVFCLKKKNKKKQ